MCSVSDTSVRCICSKDEKGVEPIVSKVARITLVALGVIACVAGAMVMLELSIPLFPTFQASTGLAFLGGGVLAGVLGITLRIMQPSSPSLGNSDKSSLSSSHSSPISQPIQGTDLTGIEAALAVWEHEEGLAETEQRGEASTRILDCCRQGSHGLQLSSLGLTSLPPVIGRLTHLESLEVPYNSLSSLPVELAALSKLIGLHFGGNNFKQFPNSLPSCLTHVWAYKNQIEEIPDTIEDLSELKALYIGMNHLKRIAPSFWKLKRLERLRLDANNLSEIPEEIAQLGALKALRVHKNPSGHVPMSIFSMESLQSISLSPDQMLPDFSPPSTLTILGEDDD